MKPYLHTLIIIISILHLSIESKCQIRGNVCPCKAPVISSHPASISGLCIANGQANFTVVATGTGPLNYQWQENQVDITDNSIYSGTHTATLTINNPSINQNNKSYRCVITNCSGTIVYTNNLSTLNLNIMPTDLNTDGVTDNGDFSILLRVYGTTCSGCTEDIDQDGQINVVDFLRLIGRYNQACF
jgi:Immunoglobulin domain